MDWEERLEERHPVLYVAVCVVTLLLFFAGVFTFFATLALYMG